MVKEGCSEDAVFFTQILMLLAAIAGETIFKMSFNISTVGAFMGLFFVSIWRFKVMGINVWEGFDSLVLPMIYFFFFAGVGGFLKTEQFVALGTSVTALFGYWLYFFLKGHYRRFFWYKSGKLGFLFWSVCFYFSTVMLVLDFLQTKKVYWSEIWWIALLIASAGAIYFRSELYKK